jgi:DNA-binding transcriptional MerR regulator
MEMVAVVNIDQEWLELIKEAKEIGLTIEEVRIFLEGTKDKK